MRDRVRRPPGSIPQLVELPFGTARDSLKPFFSRHPRPASMFIMPQRGHGAWPPVLIRVVSGQATLIVALAL